MKRKIRLYLITTGAVAALCAFAAGIFLSYNSLVKQTRLFLETQMESAIKSATVPEGIRLTVIGSDGVVIKDSEAAPNTMDNHLNRKEIRSALNFGKGSAVRKSDTLSKVSVYYAVLMDDGNVLRLSADTNSIWRVIGESLPAAVLLALLAAVLGALAAPFFTRKIIEPLETSLNENGEFIPRYEELEPFARTLENKNRNLLETSEKLGLRNKELELIMSAMNEGLIFMNEKRETTLINPAAYAIFGTDPKIEAGGDLLFFSREKKLLKAVKRAEKGETYTANADINGRTVRITASPVYENLSLMGILCVAADVTDLKRAEKIRRDFTANVSHELKTPLTSIIGYSELLSSGVKDETEVKKFAGIINKESGRLLNLIKDILKLSEVESGPFEREEPVNLFAAVHEACESLESEAVKAGVKLVLTGEDAWINGEPEAIVRLARNLIENAVKYNAPGGRADISVKSADKTVVLTVADTGIGIPSKKQDRIFERFYRADKSRSRASGGTGLGLAIVKHIVERLDGEINFVSEEGKGSVFMVKFSERDKKRETPTPDAE